MSGQSCDCDNPIFGNTGEPGCVIEQKVLAMPMISPRYGSAGTRNTIDLLSATIGQDIKDKINAVDGRDRLYPLPRVENASFPRTDTQYETAPSGKKYKLDGVGGIRTWLMELWKKSAVHQMYRELVKFGCTELDVFYIAVDGVLWGIKDNLEDTVLRGYEMDTETYDVFMSQITDTTQNKLMISWDLDRFECEEKAYAITVKELGYKATTLKGLITAFTTLTDPVDGTAAMSLFSGFGSAVNNKPIVGLVAAAPTIALYNETQEAAMTDATGLAAVVGQDGDYTFDYVTAEAALNDVIRVTITGADGYDVQVNTFAHAF